MLWKQEVRVRRIGFIAAIVLVLAAVAVAWRLEDHDLGKWPSRPLEFAGADGALAGTLWLPEGVAWGTVLLVHGDGPQDRTSGGGYAPLINALLDAGLAVGSWDKPGVGASEGNWLAQSMEDRAEEVRRALAAAGERGGPMGVLGFSQAGWVVPKLAFGEADFMVLVGPAVNWGDQGRYYTERRLEAEGFGVAEIAAELEVQAEAADAVFGPGVAYSSASGLSEARWGFVARNRESDARADLDVLSVPVLALWGAEDLNVDAATDAETYRRILEGRHPETQIRVVLGATHGLLKAGAYNYQLVSQWPWWAEARFLFEGRYAYAPGVVDDIAGWIKRIEP